MSKLDMKSIYFEKIDYKKIGFSKEKNEFSHKVNCPIYISKENDKEYKLTISLKGKQLDSFEVELVLTGIFEVEFDSEEERDILFRNAFSILFPYVRSQLTLLTSQPDMSPVVLSVINLKNEQ